MTFVATHRWFRLHANQRGPQPPLAALDAMLRELEHFMRETGVRPVRAELETWLRPAFLEPDEEKDALARLRLEVDAGAMKQSLRTWFAWQHPKWEWSRFAFPDLVALELIEDPDA